MKFNYLIIPLMTVLIVIAVYLAFQNAILREQASDANNRAQIASKQRDTIESITKQNRSYTRCIAQVFAKYTRDHLPVTNLNLDDCTTDSQTKATDDTATGGTTPAQSNAAPKSTAPKSSPQAPKTVTPSPPKPKTVCQFDNVPLLGALVKVNCKQVV